MRRFAPALATAVFLISAPPAEAATVTTRSWPTQCHGKDTNCYPIVSYRGARGERNDVVVTDEPGLLPGVRIHDASAEIALSRGAALWCSSSDPHEVVCAPANNSPYGVPVEFRLGDGDDRLVTSEVNDRFFHIYADGEEGDDELRANTSATGVAFGGGAGRDVLVGSDGGDRLTGDGSATALPFTAPERTASDDTIDGGPGVDTVDYRGRATAVVVDLAARRGGGRGERDNVENVENVESGAGPDRLAGDGGPNALDAGPGNDRVAGRGGDDSLAGGDGINQAFGGAGDDTLHVGRFDRTVKTFTFAGCGRGRDRVGGVDGHAEVLDDCEEAGSDAASPDYRLFGPLRSMRSRIVELDTHCDMTLREQQRHMVCRWRLALVTSSGQVVGIKSVRTHRVPGNRTVRIAVRLNRRGRALLKRREPLRVKLRVAAGLTRQHGGIPKPATTAFSTWIRLRAEGR